MLNTVSSCHDQLESLQKLKNSIPFDSWADCNRMIDRCESFRDIVRDLLDSPHLLEDVDEKEERCLDELEKTLLEAEAYVKEFVLRTSYFGITDSTYRQGCSTDFFKIMKSIFRLTLDLNVASEIDYDRIRIEDLAVRHSLPIFSNHLISACL
jgi:hypothetical protein